MTNRDFKIGHFVKLRQVVLPEIKTAELSTVAASFSAAALGVKSLSLFPLIGLYIANRKEQLRGAAHALVFGGLEVEPIQQSHPQYQEFISKLDTLWTDFLSRGGEDYEKETQRAWNSAIEHMNKNSENKLFRPGLEAWMSAQIVGAWTAFETLAGDLWEAALNSHPAGLSELKGPRSDGAGDGKSVPLNILQQFKFDLSKSMGTVLKQKYSFDRLENIRDHYFNAFYRDNDRIEAILNNKAIDALSSTRHLIVHRSSIVDQRYLNRSKNLPAAPQALVGQPILLDGETIVCLVDPVLQLGRDLIMAVDDWLVSH